MRTITRLTVFAVLVILIAGTHSCQSPELTSAKVYLQQSNMPKAEEMLLKARETEPNNAEVPFLLATQIYAPRRDWVAAKQMLELAAQLNPAGYQTKAQNEINHMWGEVLNDGAALFNKAIGALFREDQDSLMRLATKRFELAMVLNDNKPETYDVLVKTYFKIGDTLRVIETAEKALRKGLFDEDVVYFYGQMLFRSGQEDIALAKLAEISQQHPDAIELFKLQVQFLTEKDRYDDALALMEKAIANNPKEIDLKFIIAQIFVKLSRLEDAQFYYQQVLASNPDDTEVLTRIAEAFFISKEWIQAEEYARHLIELVPEDSFGWDVLWKSVYNQGRLEEAEGLRQKALELR